VTTGAARDAFGAFAAEMAALFPDEVESRGVACHIRIPPLFNHYDVTAEMAALFLRGRVLPPRP
jgi:hypothetical protein